MKETKLYVGLNDSVTLKQLFDDEKYIKTLTYVCSNYHVPFSFSVIESGYYQSEENFIYQNTLVITLINVDDNVVDEIAKDLCVFFRQKSVMISYNDVEAKLIKESLE